MNFREGDVLYWVCPFTFIIDMVEIKFSVLEHDGLYWIDEVGAYLKEDCLFHTIEEAKGSAFKRLNYFYGNKMKEILDYKDEHFKKY